VRQFTRAAPSTSGRARKQFLISYQLNSLVPAQPDKKHIDRVLEIERELLRRWKAGDAEAKLPQFEKSVSEQK